MSSIIRISVSLVLLMSFVVFGEQSQYYTLKQPNGVTFQVKEAGYCCYLRWYETKDGHVIVRGADKYYQYATTYTEKGFASSGLKVGIDEPVDVIKNLKDYPQLYQQIEAEAKRYNNAVEKNRQLFLKFQGKSDDSDPLKDKGLNKTMTATTLDIGILLVEFNDLQHFDDPFDGPYTQSDFNNAFFSENTYYSSATPAAYTPDDENVYGSMKDYYQVQSSGDLIITGSVINPVVNNELVWINLGNSSNYPAAFGGIAPPTNLIYDAINAAIDNGWNANYSVTQIIVAGSNTDLYSTGVGYPKSFFNSNGFRASFDYNNWLGAPAFHERCYGWAGVYSGGNSFTHIGIWCHELGHVIGSGLLGGLMAHPNGDAGDWSVMGVGYRTGSLRKGDCPGNFDPPAIISYGWNSPTVISNNLTSESIQYINNKTQQKDFYRYNVSSSNKIFIIENRQYNDFNSYLPDYWQASGLGGLIVWEWDGINSNTRTIRPGDNDFDDAPGGPPYWTDGDGGDPFPGLSNNRSITMATTPNTNINTTRTGFCGSVQSFV